MKKIAIISPDTVPLPLKENCPETITEKGNKFLTKDKCKRFTAIGKRSWQFASYLSNIDEFDVTLLVPNLNAPPKEYIDYDKVGFQIQTYNFKAANWQWSDELDRKLIKYDFVILQSVTGTGFQNCAVLPKEVNVILDGWVPFLAEMPCILLTYNRVYRKLFWTKTMIPQYQDLIRRSNCILYANNRQHSYYEGQFFMTQKLNWKSFKFSPLLKVPYGVDRTKPVEKTINDIDKLKLLWYGPAYPWYCPEKLIEKLKYNEHILIDFVGIEHPRCKRIYNSYFKNFFDTVADTPNINVIEEYCDDSLSLFKNYDAGIILANDWLEEKYSHRCRVLEMAASGFPVIINEGNSLYEELDFLKPMLHPVRLNHLVEDLIDIKEHKEKLNIKEDELEKVYQVMSWDNVISPLIDYIRRF